MSDPFDKLKNKMRDLSPLMLEISEIMYEDVYRNFEEEGRPKRWQKLSKKTLEQRRKKGYTGKILQRRGMAEGLLGSIQSGNNANQSWLSTNLVYAAIHNYGGIIHRGSISSYLRSKKNKNAGRKKMSSIRMPKREFMKISPEGFDKIYTAAKKYILD